MTEPRDLLLDTEPKDRLLVVEQLRRSNRRWKALALAACAVLALVVCFSIVAATRARIQTEHAMRAERLARQNAELARAQAQRAVNPGQPR
jgi:hypothetical protein